MTAEVSHSVNFNSLFVRMDDVSENPNRLWSVKTTGRPSVRKHSVASCASTENAWWQCTMSTCSRIAICLSNRKLMKSVGNEFCL